VAHRCATHGFAISSCIIELGSPITERKEWVGGEYGEERSVTGGGERIRAYGDHKAVIDWPSLPPTAPPASVRERGGLEEKAINIAWVSLIQPENTI
jgi:hypothetical protein